jgi:THO complex subunit 3
MTEGVPPEFAYDLVPAHRQGNFNEIAGTLLYMVGKSGAYLNGSVQLVDGGRLSVFESTY